MKSSRSASSCPQSAPKNFDSDDIDSGLPPVISSNTREKIKGENISVTELNEADRKKRDRGVSVRWVPTPVTPLEPHPHYSLTVAWDPSTLCFSLDEETVVKQLMVQNRSTHSIYIQCCGLWDSTARLGASWKSYPRTRYLLAPGLMAVFAIRVTPREYPSPLPSAQVALQLAAAHMRDNVVGYFAVPIQVRFNNYIPPPEHGAECS